MTLPLILPTTALLHKPDSIGKLCKAVRSPYSDQLPMERIGLPDEMLAANRDSGRATSRACGWLGGFSLTLANLHDGLLRQSPRLNEVVE